jgi:glycosyltransferase involved in cell wall biosynthesis
VSPGCVGLSAVHSLAYGVPMLVARDEAHGPEQVVLRDGVSAAFCASDDPRSLADSLVTLLRDGRRLGAMGEAGRRTVRERFSVSAMAATFERAVAFALSGEAPAPAGPGHLATAGRPGH